MFAVVQHAAFTRARRLWSDLERKELFRIWKHTFENGLEHLSPILQFPTTLEPEGWNLDVCEPCCSSSGVAAARHCRRSPGPAQRDRSGALCWVPRARLYLCIDSYKLAGEERERE